MPDEIVPALCELGRRYLALTEGDFAEAIAGGDFERADVAAGEAVTLSQALKRQERSNKEERDG